MEDILQSLKKDLDVVGEYFLEVSEGILENKISQYPIFVAHREADLPLGKMIINAEMTKTNWSYNASFAEDFLRKGVIAEDKFELFKETYKPPQQSACFFVLTNEIENFVFTPYPITPSES